VGLLAGGLKGCYLVLVIIVWFWGRLSVLATAICSGDGYLFWRRPSILAMVVSSGDGG